MQEFITDVERFRQQIKYWWLTLILGIVVFIMGIVIFRHPGESYIALSVIFGILVLFSGILQIFLGSYAPKHTGRGWLIASGVIETIIGLILIFNIGMSAIVLPFFLGFWLLFRGISLIGIVSDMRDCGIKGTGWTIFLAVLLILSAIMVLIFPAIGVGAIVIWLGLSFILAGIAMIWYSIRLMNLKKDLRVK